MTMTEAIIARRSGQSSVNPGDNVWVNVDKLMTHDVCGPGTFGVFEKEFGASAKVILDPRMQRILIKECLRLPCVLFSRAYVVHLSRTLA